MSSDEALPQILVVDDDAGIRELLTQYLDGQGFATSAVADGAAMDAWLRDRRPDLIILDLMLPGEDGLALTRRLRAAGNIPIIMLTARGDEIDRIVGLEVGADDYLPKPFNPRELLARIKAVLRRAVAPVSQSDESPSGIRFGPFELDPEREILRREGEPVVLTGGEMELLLVLAEHPGRVWSRDQLMDRLSGQDRDPFDRSIDVRVTRLRGKIEPEPHTPRYLRTVWGRGYRFVLDGDDA